MLKNNCGLKSKNVINNIMDHLDEDAKIPKQNFVCISFLSPEKVKGSENKNIRGLKIRGCFETREEADKHVEKLRQADKLFDIYVGEVGKWLPWDETEQVEDEKYDDEQLQTLMEGYKKSRHIDAEDIKQRINATKTDE